METTMTDVRQEALVWKPVAGVQAVVFIATADDGPVAIIELRPGDGFHVTMCTGENLGQFDRLVDGQVAVAARLEGDQRASADSR